MPTPGEPVAPLRSLPLGPPVAGVEPSPPVTPVAPVPPAVPGAAVVAPVPLVVAPTPLAPGLTPGPEQSEGIPVLPLVVLWPPVFVPLSLPVVVPVFDCSFRAVVAGVLVGAVPVRVFAQAEPTSEIAATHASDEYLIHR